MWILTILSETAIHTIFGIGVLGVIAGFVLGFIPLIRAYKLAIQICSIILLVFGVYLEGGLADYKEWELKVKEMEAQMAEAKAKGAEKNIEIQEKIVEKTKIVREKGRDIIKYIDREVVKDNEVIKYVEQCPNVPASVIEQMNKAATK
jgi:uncharacterized membrane protein (DUF106 family)